MRGCLRKLGIIIGVLVVLIGIIAIIYTLNWNREERLAEQARDAYIDGNAPEALVNYQKLRDGPGLIESLASEAQNRIDEMELYLEAVRLREEGYTDKAITEYEKYLDEYIDFESRGNFYGYHARQALANLILEKAQELYEQGEFANAVDYQMVLLDFQMVGIEGCEQHSIGFDDEAVCQDTEFAIGQNQLEVQEAIPALILEWIAAIEQQGNYQDFADHCERILQEYPDMLSTREMKSKIAQVYSDWAVSLRKAERFKAAIEVYETIQGIYSDTPTGDLVLAELNDTRAELDIWFLENPAVPLVEFSEELSRDLEDFWILTTVFKEIGGNVGYELNGSGWIINAEGKKYSELGLGTVGRGPVTVPAGGESEDTYRFYGDVFVDGYAVFTWEGEDEGGHVITIEERVHLLP